MKNCEHKIEYKFAHLNSKNVIPIPFFKLLSRRGSPVKHGGPLLFLEVIQLLLLWKFDNNVDYVIMFDLMCSCIIEGENENVGLILRFSEGGIHHLSTITRDASHFYPFLEPGCGARLPPQPFLH